MMSFAPSAVGQSTGPLLPLPGPVPTTTTTVDPSLPGLVQLQVGVEIPNRVFVGGCPYAMTEKELGDFFSQFGPVKDSKIVFDKTNGKSLGYGFVTYVTEADAISVYSKGSIFYNEKKLNVSKAIRKHGSQYVRPSQEVMGNVYLTTPPGNYMVSRDGGWGFLPAHNYNETVAPLIYPTPQYYQATPKAPPTHIIPHAIELKSTMMENTTVVEDNSINSSFSSDEFPNPDQDLPESVDLDRMFEYRKAPPRRRVLPPHFN